MPLSQRAKQFMPFSVLTGLEDALRAKEREMGLIDKPELSDEAEAEINDILVGLEAGDQVEIDYFRDGEIICVKGEIEKIGGGKITVDGVHIKINDIIKTNVYI